MATKAANGRKRTKKQPGLEQPPIPEIAAARHVRLDSLCERIGRSIDERNTLERQEEVDKDEALKYMLKRELPAYSHFGCELILRPGATRIIARKHKATVATMDGDQEL